jgi:hypothetical protein
MKIWRKKNKLKLFFFFLCFCCTVPQWDLPPLRYPLREAPWPRFEPETGWLSGRCATNSATTPPTNSATTPPTQPPHLQLSHHTSNSATTPPTQPPHLQLSHHTSNSATTPPGPTNLQWSVSSWSEIKITIVKVPRKQICVLSTKTFIGIAYIHLADFLRPKNWRIHTHIIHAFLTTTVRYNIIFTVMLLSWTSEFSAPAFFFMEWTYLWQGSS